MLAHLTPILQNSRKQEERLTINNQRLIDLKELFFCEFKVSEVATLTGLLTVMTMNPTSLFHYNIQHLKNFFHRRCSLQNIH